MMKNKKWIIILGVIVIFLSMPVITFAQTWITTNQITVAWDAVAPVVAGDTIKYQVYTRIGTIGDGSKVGSEIAATQATLTFTQEGRYFIGIETIRYPQGETVGIPSETKAWSNVVADCAAAGPFGVVYFAPPGKAKGLKRVP